MKKYLCKTEGIAWEVSKASVPKLAPNGVQKMDAATGFPIHLTELLGFVNEQEGSFVIPVACGVADAAGSAVAGAGRGDRPGDDPVVAEGPRWRDPVWCGVPREGDPPGSAALTSRRCRSPNCSETQWRCVPGPGSLLIGVTVTPARSLNKPSEEDVS